MREIGRPSGRRRSCPGYTAVHGPSVSRHNHVLAPDKRRVLPRPVALRDVPDVEALAVGVLAQARAKGVCRQLSDDEYVEFVDELIVRLYELEGQFDPTRGVAFRSFVWWRLGHHVIERIRQLSGRSGQRVAPGGVVSFDDSAGAGLDRLEDATAASALDLAGSRFPDCGGLFKSRGGQVAEDVAGGREQAPRRTSAGDREPTTPATRERRERVARLYGQLGSIKAVAAALDAPRERVRSDLRALGLVREYDTEPPPELAAYQARVAEFCGEQAA